MYNGLTIDNSVSVQNFGSGPTETVAFGITTSSLFTTKNLNLVCMISGTLTPVKSSNTIAFTVIACTYTSMVPNPSSYPL